MELTNHVVFADPTNAEARGLQADALEQMGYRSESGPWRNFYLTGAKGLREVALGGAFWGFLFGLIFFVPFLGAAVGAGAAASLSTSLENEGIGEEFIKRVDEEVTEGTSALFALTSGAADREEVVAELTQHYDFEIIWTDLPEDELQKLREDFGV